MKTFGLLKACLQQHIPLTAAVMVEVVLVEKEVCSSGDSSSRDN